jgi:hypothetical protein
MNYHVPSMLLSGLRERLIRCTKKLFFLQVILLIGFLPSSISAQSCRPVINVSLDQMGQATITPQITISGFVSDYSIYTVDIVGPLTNQVFCSQVGIPTTAITTNTQTNSSCSSRLMVEDKLPPRITNCNSPVEVWCSQVDLRPTLKGGTVPSPTIEDNCTTANSQYSDQIENIQCGDPRIANFSAIITRKWDAWDNNNGMFNTCFQTINLRRAVLADVVYPIDRQVEACTNPTLTPTAMGTPTVNGFSIFNTPGMACELSTSFMDKIIPGCGASYRICRTWTTLDQCSGVKVTYIQNIDVKDTQAPVLTCTPQTVSINQTNCTFSGTLPTAGVVETCSSPVTFVTSTPFSWTQTNGGVHSNLVPGVWTVTVTATDACGNTGTCTYPLSVVDRTTPTMICTRDIQFVGPVISLNNFGLAEVLPDLIDQGSFDDCGLAKLEVARMGPNPIFGPSVTVNCNDISTRPVIILRGTDNWGNTNTCMSNLIVQDKLAPTITCPPNVTLECTGILPDPTNYGTAVPADNCSATVAEGAPLFNINKCKTGSITRFFTATDPRGLTATCSQTIFINKTTFIGASDITFPRDTNIIRATSPLCTANFSPVSTGEPRVRTTACDIVLFSFEDDSLWTDIEFKSCGKILRRWSVFDECSTLLNFPPSSPPVIYSRVQEIVVSDTSKPKIKICPANETWGVGTNCLHTWRQRTPIVIEDCAGVVNSLTINGFPFVSGTQDLPVGIYRMVYTITDRCSNSSSCTQIVTVRDTIKPMIECRHVSLNFGSGPTATVNVLDLVNQVNGQPIASDNCGINCFSFSPTSCVTSKVLTCDSLGRRGYRVYARDIHGNSDFCVSVVTLTDNMGVCTPAVPACGSCQNVTISDCNYCCPELDINNIADYEFRVNGTVRPTQFCTINTLSYSTPSTNVPDLGINFAGFRVVSWVVNGVNYNSGSTILANDDVALIAWMRGVDPSKDWFKIPTTGLNGTAIRARRPNLGPPIGTYGTIVLDIVPLPGRTPLSGFVNLGPSTGFAALQLGVRVNTGVNTVQIRRISGACATQTVTVTSTAACRPAPLVAMNTMKENNDIISNVSIEVNGDTTNWLTNSSGEVSILGLQDGGDYTFVPTKKDNLTNGVDTRDLMRIQQHLLGVRPFSSSYQFVAADITGNGRVTAADIAELRKIILGSSTELPNKKDAWAFIPRSEKVDPYKQDWTKMPFVANANNLSDTLAIVFDGIKYGDIDLSASSANVQTLTTRNETETAELELIDQELIAGQVYEIPVEINESSEGWQFTLGMEDSKIEYLGMIFSNNMLSADNFSYHANLNALTASYHGKDLAGKELFTLKVRALQNGKLSDVLNVNSSITSAKLFTEEKVKEISLGFKNQESNLGSIQLFAARPNPMASQTVLGFELPMETEVKFFVTDASGRMVKSIVGNYARGYNEFILTETEIPTAGLYFVKMETAQGTQIRKVVKQ